MMLSCTPGGDGAFLTSSPDIKCTCVLDVRCLLPGSPACHDVNVLLLLTSRCMAISVACA